MSRRLLHLLFANATTSRIAFPHPRPIVDNRLSWLNENGWLLPPIAREPRSLEFSGYGLRQTTR
jgi:hypothetical protein